MKTVLVAALLVSTNVMAEMYKCEDVEGSVTYTELPCAEERLTFIKKIEIFEEDKPGQNPDQNPDQNLAVFVDPTEDYLSKISSLAECAGMYFSNHDEVTEYEKRLRLHATKKLRNSHEEFDISEDKFVLLFSEGFKKGMQKQLAENEFSKNRSYCSILAKTELNHRTFEENQPFQLVGN